MRWLTVLLILCSLGLALVSLAGTAWDTVRLFGLPQVYGHLPRWIQDIGDGTPFNPRVTGMALATLFPVPFALLLFGRNKRNRALSGVAVLVVGLTLLLTQSLQAAIGVACALLFLAACWNRWFLVCVPLLLGALLLGLRAYGTQPIADAALAMDNPLGIAAALRLDMWSRALAMIHDMPYTGIGLDTFPLVQSNFYPGVIIGPEPHAHNLFLQIALDLGVPGLFAFLWLLLRLGCAAFKTQRRCRDPDLRALLLGAVGGSVSYLASGFLDTIWTAKPSVLLWLLLGVVATLSVAVDPSAKRRASRTLPAFVRRCLPTFLLLILLYPGLVVARGGPDLNLSTLRAHKLLLSLQAGERPPREALESVAEDLRRVVRVKSNNAHLYNVLGRVLGWLGEYPASLQALNREVGLDGENAVARYAPFESLRRRIEGTEGHDKWDDTLRIYRPWMSRFPERAESYVLVALVRDQYQNDPKTAASVLNSGIARGAEPRGLLLYYLGQLSE